MINLHTQRKKDFKKEEYKDVYNCSINLSAPMGLSNEYMDNIVISIYYWSIELRDTIYSFITS